MATCSRSSRRRSGSSSRCRTSSAATSEAPSDPVPPAQGDIVISTVNGGIGTFQSGGPEQVEDIGRETLEELDHDVPCDRVGDHDIGLIAGEVLALDVADEVQVARVEQLRRPLDPLVALALLLADREEGDTRPREIVDALDEDRAHPGVLGEVLSRGVGVRPDVQEDELRGSAPHGRERSRPIRGDRDLVATCFEQHRERGGDLRVIVDDQHLAAVPRFGRGCRRLDRSRCSDPLR